MVEDKIILHEKKINYLMFAIGFAVLFSIVSAGYGNYFYNRILVNYFKDNYDVLIYFSQHAYYISIIFKIINIPGIIISFIFARKILINKRFTIFVFILTLVNITISLIASLPWLNLPGNIMSIITGTFSTVVFVFILLILIRNKILSKLLIVSMIFIGVQLPIQIFAPFIRENILSLGLVSSYHSPVSEMLTILNLVILISDTLVFVGYVLVIIYLVKCFIKNNIFNIKKLNIILSLVILLGPSIILNIIMMLKNIIFILIS